MYLSLFIHSPMERHLDCLQFGALVNKAVMYIHVWALC